jgi:hypothetical protein
MQSREGMMPGMALIRSFAPDSLLEQREALALIDDQIRQLTTIGEELKVAEEAALAAHGRHRSQLHQALMASDPDASAIRTHFDGAHAAMGHAHWLAIDAAITARALLTQEQRTQVETGTPRSGQGAGMQSSGCMQGGCGATAQDAGRGMQATHQGRCACCQGGS